MRAWARPRPRWHLVLIVLLAHLGLLWLLGARSARDVVRWTTLQAPTVVWWPSLPLPASPTAVEPIRPARVPEKDAPRRAQVTEAAPTRPVDPAPVPQATTGEAITQPSGEDGRAGAASGTETSPGPVAPGLRLSLPRGAAPAAADRNPALVSPTRARPPWTVESRIAAALGSGTWVEERMGEDMVRFRQGNRCVVLRRPRSSNLDPFNATMHVTPWLTAGVQSCED